VGAIAAGSWAFGRHTYVLSIRGSAAPIP
jgi:hypothetical protein